MHNSTLHASHAAPIHHYLFIRCCRNYLMVATAWVYFFGESWIFNNGNWIRYLQTVQLGLGLTEPFEPISRHSFLQLTTIQQTNTLDQKFFPWKNSQRYPSTTKINNVNALPRLHWHSSFFKMAAFICYGTLLLSHQGFWHFSPLTSHVSLLCPNPDLGMWLRMLLLRWTHEN